jgi:hypothetical protein
VDVVIANQGTLIPLFERHWPHVVFASWLVGGTLASYLNGIHRRTHLVLVDQEGGRLGEQAFKRTFVRMGGIKRDAGRVCARVLTWGEAQAGWLTDIGVVDRARIVVTGSPRFDPYLVPPAVDRPRYLGITLRGEAITSLPFSQMENLFESGAAPPGDGLSVGYPVNAQFEDRIWHVLASTRHMFRIASEVAARSKAKIVMRPGPWEQQQMYAFLPQRIPTVTIAPDQSQPDYVAGAFAVVDEASSLSLEAHIAGKPVISTQALIPRLEEHIGGHDGASFNAPYTRGYWRPSSVDEAVDLILRAERGELAPTPTPNPLEAYLRDCHGWPRSRPSSFRTADVLLELLDVPLGSRAEDDAVDDGATGTQRLKRTVYRHVPGAAAMSGAKLYAQSVTGRDPQLFRRYNYFASLYPHEAEVSRTFSALLRLTGEAA